MSVYQWLGSSNADLANEGNWANTSNPGTVGVPGTNDVAIIQVGQGLYGVLDVDALDIVQASGAPIVTITGSSTQVTAASVGIGYGFTLDDGAYLQAGAMGIDGDGTSVTVQNGAYLYDDATAENDVLTIGAGSGTASVLVTKGGTFAYESTYSSGTLNLGGASQSVATLMVSAGGYFSSDLSNLTIGAAAGSTGALVVTGAGSQFLIDNYGLTTIGDFGELTGGSSQGSVTVSAGGYASLDSFSGVYIGTSAGMAKVVVTGANSAIQAGPFVEVGVDGTNIAGEILVQSGGEFDTFTDTDLNNGTIQVTGANSLYTGRVLSADSGATITAATGGFIHVADVQLGGKLVLNAGSLNARSGFYMYGGSVLTGAGAVTATTLGNAGTIIANGGTLTINGPITGVGKEQINAGATLQLNGATVATQALSFSGANGVLTLASGDSFAGSIAKFVAGDKIIDNGSITDSGFTETFAGTLSGSGSLVKSGAGTLVLNGTESAFTGGLAISGGALELATSGGLVAPVTFSGASTIAKLKIDAADRPGPGTTFADALVDFDNSMDRVDLAGLAYTAGATATVSGSTLTLSDGGKTYKFTLQGTISAAYKVISDGAGGTTFMSTAPPPAAKPALFAQAMASLGQAASGSNSGPHPCPRGRHPSHRHAYPALTIRAALPLKRRSIRSAATLAMSVQAVSTSITGSSSRRATISASSRNAGRGGLSIIS